MIGRIQKNDKGELEVKKDGDAYTPVSTYQPSQDIATLTRHIGHDYQQAYDLQNQPFTEFNDMSLLDRADLDQKRWNAYRQPQSDDIDEAWRWHGVRPITRNRILAILASTTANIVMPAPFAQNDQDEIDRMAALVMRDLMEYNIRNSSYVDDYISWLTDALVNPAAYLGVGFFEVLQTIRTEEGKKQVIDNVLSGFQTHNIPLDEILIANFYERSLERQRFVFRRRIIDFDEASALYGEHDNFEFVSPGVRTIFDGEAEMFYDVYDENIGSLVEEVVYKNRLDDVEIPFVNGIYHGDDDIENNPIKHRDNEDRPKYNFAVLGYEELSSRFFYHMSASRKMGDDDELVIRTEQLAADAVFLGTMPPTITTGIGQMSEAVVIPGKNTAFENPNVNIAPIQLGSQLNSAFNLLLKKEQDMSESTQDPITAGISTGPNKSATEAALLAENARVAQGRFGNMVVSSLKKAGGLMIDVIIQHQTVMDVEETADGEMVEKFKSFVLTDVEDDFGPVTHKLIFEPNATDEDTMSQSLRVLDEEGGLNSDTRIFRINPEKWRKLKYNLVMDVKELVPAAIKEIQQQQQRQMEQERQQSSQNIIGSKGRAVPQNI